MNEGQARGKRVDSTFMARVGRRGAWRCGPEARGMFVLAQTYGVLLAPFNRPLRRSTFGASSVLMSGEL